MEIAPRNANCMAFVMQIIVHARLEWSQCNTPPKVHIEVSTTFCKSYSNVWASVTAIFSSQKNSGIQVYTVKTLLPTSTFENNQMNGWSCGSAPYVAITAEFRRRSHLLRRHVSHSNPLIDHPHFRSHNLLQWRGLPASISSGKIKWRDLCNHNLPTPKLFGPWINTVFP